jgi:hypothetical protein
MTEPLWVQVQGPNGPTTIQLSPEWQEAAKDDAPVSDEMLISIVKRAALRMQHHYVPVDGPFSQLVRLKARQMLLDMSESAS